MGNLNPLRYRGYYYDAEIGLYWLTTRIYDPQTGRFINSDSADLLGSDLQSVLQYNMYAYCWNNPVNMYDPEGDLPIFLIFLVATVITVEFASCNTQKSNYNHNKKQTL